MRDRVAGVQPRISRTVFTSMQNSWPPMQNEISSRAGSAWSVGVGSRGSSSLPAKAESRFRAAFSQEPERRLITEQSWRRGVELSRQPLTLPPSRRFAPRPARRRPAGPSTLAIRVLQHFPAPAASPRLARPRADDARRGKRIRSVGAQGVVRLFAWSSARVAALGAFISEAQR